MWDAALVHHYHHNPHHPQHIPGHRMALSHLEESVVDMMACNWERKMGGGDGVTAEEMADISDIFLERYLPEDRETVKQIFEKIKISQL